MNSKRATYPDMRGRSDWQTGKTHNNRASFASGRRWEQAFCPAGLAQTGHACLRPYAGLVSSLRPVKNALPPKCA